ncbi:hypothetical protein AGMMS50248_01630 [Deltaproteobacteria bacterium]|nr:hypothetical protein AGMMS50248_01630 [Deltaproteobacteria bacterium]
MLVRQEKTAHTQRMNIAAVFIRRPVATTLIILGMLFFGSAGYLSLPVNQLPNVDFPTILVMADLEGADPETMAASVATPLEKEFFTIAGLTPFLLSTPSAAAESSYSSRSTGILMRRRLTFSQPSGWRSAACPPT